METDVHTKTCSNVYSNFIVTPNWKQLKSSSTDEKVHKLTYNATIHNKKEQNSDSCHSMDKSQKYLIGQNEPKHKIVNARILIISFKKDKFSLK
jgi:hypothetical protein